MDFPNYSSVFSNPTFGASNFTYGGETLFNPKNKKKGASMFFDPATMVLGGANLIGSIFGANKAAETQASVANAQMAAAADQLKWQTMLGREQAYGQAGQEIAGRVAQGTWMPDLELGRQMFARNKELREFAPVQMALNTEGIRRGFDLNASAAAREQSQRENREALKRSLAEKEGVMAGMFGSIARPGISATFV
jgi:hypothetical protein